MPLVALGWRMRKARDSIFTIRQRLKVMPKRMVNLSWLGLSGLVGNFRRVQDVWPGLSGMASDGDVVAYNLFLNPQIDFYSNGAALNQERIHRFLRQEFTALRFELPI